MILINIQGEKRNLKQFSKFRTEVDQIIFCNCSDFLANLALFLATLFALKNYIWRILLSKDNITIVYESCRVLHRI